MAVKLIDIKRTYSGGGMCLKLLADSKEDTLPTLIADVPGAYRRRKYNSGQCLLYTGIRYVRHGK